MSSAFTAKLVEIIYFLIPTAILIASIIFWEKNYGKKEPKNGRPIEDKLK